MAFLRQVASGIDDWLGFQANASEPRRKRPASAATPVVAGESRAAGAALEPCPFDSRQGQWLQHAMGGALTHLAAAVDVRVSKAESYIKAVQDSCNQAWTQVDKMKRELEKVKGDFFEVRQTAADRPMEHAPSPPPQAAPRADEHCNEIPYELRTDAVIGNSGWDSTSAQVLEKARARLAAANVLPEQFHALTPVVNRSDRGSLAKLQFSSPAHLQAAKLKVRATNVQGLSGRSLWVDAAKTPRELKPARVVHRIAECLVDLELAREAADRITIEKVMGGKRVISIAGKIGFTCRGEWH